MTFADFQTLVDQHRPSDGRRLAVPVYVRRSADLLTPVSAYLALREPGQISFLLESVEGGEHLGRYSFLGRRPYMMVEARGAMTHLHYPSGDVGGDGVAPASQDVDQTVFEVMAELMAETTLAPVPGLPRFTGGAVGFMGYDTVRLLERLPDGPPDGLCLPDALWGFFDTLAAFDHVRHQLVLMATAFVDEDTDLQAAYDDARFRLEDLEATLQHPGRPGPTVRPLSQDVASNTAQNDFENAVRTAKHHIVEGDIFQLVLSQRFAFPFEGDHFNLYRALRQVNPSPYLFHLDLALPDGTEFALIGSSPEVLARVEPQDGALRAEVMPIAGTRRRGSAPEEDLALEADLIADAKEQAEHLMLVDLGRNDLGRVCEVGTVTVDRFAQVERFSHVMHLVSSVSGTVASQEGFAVLGACFPAGTVSGAPKVRAMELIDGLEPTRRGPYAGAVGYAGFDGALDTCIAIRTFVVHDQTAYVQAGAGIVADSDPTAEYKETQAKAAALAEAFRVAASDLL